MSKSTKSVVKSRKSRKPIEFNPSPETDETRAEVAAELATINEQIADSVASGEGVADLITGTQEEDTAVLASEGIVLAADQPAPSAPLDNAPATVNAVINPPQARYKFDVRNCLAFAVHASRQPALDSDVLNRLGRAIIRGATPGRFNSARGNSVTQEGQTVLFVNALISARSDDSQSLAIVRALGAVKSSRADGVHGQSAYPVSEYADFATAIKSDQSLSAIG